jgi:hypothetical protein
MRQRAVPGQHGAEGNLSEHAWVHPRTKQAWPEQQCVFNIHRKLVVQVANQQPCDICAPDSTASVHAMQ